MSMMTSSGWGRGPGPLMPNLARRSSSLSQSALYLDRRFMALVVERLVGAFDFGQQPGEDLLRSKLTARGVDRESTDHRLRHGARDLPPPPAALGGRLCL